MQCTGMLDGDAFRLLRVVRATALLVLWLLATPTHAWKRWDWPANGPDERFGHSVLVFGRKVLMFGGRSNDLVVEHNPRTYRIAEVSGVLDVTTYDQQPVRECAADDTTCTYDISIAEYYNDVWQYDLDCARWADNGCAYRGWEVLNAGARFGGCEIMVKPASGEWREDCPLPFERYLHAAAMHEFRDTGWGIVVYGGFGHFCGDFCSDIWVFNVNARNWTRAAHLKAGEGPGKRWNAAVTSDANSMYLFGGHRLWHGFRQDNSIANLWSNTDEEFPFGGYLNDLWRLDLETLTWSNFQPVTQCRDAPGLAWSQRFDRQCWQDWPGRRSAGALSLGPRNTLLLHGGYTTPFPYPTTGSAGSQRGVRRSTANGRFPYATHPYYLDDLWQFNITSGLWTVVKSPSVVVPAARSAHATVFTPDAMILFGGYSNNVYFDDLWLFNFTTLRWAQKRSFVHPLYPSTCTDDTLAAPNVRSVRGHPTRFTEVDGQAGRLSEHLFIPQKRRRAPGWDGCRDRTDGRTHLTNQLLWERPEQRSGHSVAYLAAENMVVMYGGRGYEGPVLPNLTFTGTTRVTGELWTYDLDQCIKNCSGNGRCYYGYCLCHDGYYGVDCSNVSCPGDHCYYDAFTLEQVCVHCCHAPFQHADNSSFSLRERKVPCSLNNPGQSRGVCDGFGRCQCAPPFITDDCSTRDCPDQCSGNGWCSVEYPISRCVCNPGWQGDSCQLRTCLNNCSYPNGVCDDGVCDCSGIPNPYNRTDIYAYYSLLDCSGGVPFAGASALSPSWLALAVSVAMGIALRAQVVRQGCSLR